MNAVVRPPGLNTFDSLNSWEGILSLSLGFQASQQDHVRVMRSVTPSSEGVPIGLSAEPVPAADGSVSAEDGVLVTVQLGLGHHQAGVVIGAPMFDACTKKNSFF